jgi:hypothetical protein
MTWRRPQAKVLLGHAPQRLATLPQALRQHQRHAVTRRSEAEVAEEAIATGGMGNLLLCAALLQI